MRVKLVGDLAFETVVIKLHLAVYELE